MFEKGNEFADIHHFILSKTMMSLDQQRCFNYVINQTQQC
jgi:hypothetical protein